TRSAGSASHHVRGALSPGCAHPLRGFAPPGALLRHPLRGFHSGRISYVVPRQRRGAATSPRSRAMSRSYTNLLYHLVFSTKERQPTLDAAVRPRLWEYLGGAIRGEGGIALLVNGMADHVHILAKLRQDKAVSDVLRAIKANSSGWIHDTFPQMQ